MNRRGFLRALGLAAGGSAAAAAAAAAAVGLPALPALTKIAPARTVITGGAITTSSISAKNIRVGTILASRLSYTDLKGA